MAHVPLNPPPLVAQMPMNSPPLVAQMPLYPPPQVAQMPLNPPPQVAQMPRLLGSEPCSVTCPSCGAAVVTSIHMQPTTRTHLMALLLCCLCILCACIPYCVDSCQNADHHCPNCGAYLGTYKRT